MDGNEISTMLGLVRRMGIQDWKLDLKNLMAQTRANDMDVATLADMAMQNADALLQHFPPVTTEDLAASLAQAIDVNLPQITKVAQEGQKKTPMPILRC